MDKKLHFYFSLTMTTVMVTIMSFIVTVVNIGINEHLLGAWLSSLWVAWLCAFPIIYFLSPVIRKQVTKWITS